MADDFRISLGLTIKDGEIEKIRNQIKTISNNVSIPITFDQTKLDNEISKARQKIQNLNNAKVNLNINGSSSKLAGKATTDELQTTYNKLKNISKNIGSIKIALPKLDASQDINQMKVLEAQLQSFTNEYHKCVEKIKSSNKGDLSAKQWQTIQQQIDRTGITLEQLNAKLADTKAKLANKIQMNLFDSGNFASQINSVNSQFDKLKVKTESVTVAYRQFNLAAAELQLARQSGDVNAIIAANTRYETVLKNVNNQLRDSIKAEQDRARTQANSQTLALNRTALNNDINNWLRNNSAAAKDFGERLDVIRSKITSADATQLKNLRKEFQNVTKEAELAGKATQTFGGRLKSQISKLGTYYSATMMFMQAQRLIREMYHNVVEVDTAMTELYRVTDLTGKQYDALYDRMIQSAKEYGSALTDIINSTAEWVRLGFNADDSVDLAEISTMYQHIADIDNDTAIENLVTAYKGYENELKNLYDGDSTAAVEYIADIYNELGNKFALSSDDVGQGVRRAASALAVAGNTIQQTAAMVTGITEVTQDPEKAGNALKVVSMRIRGMKGELEELGEEVDDNVTNISKMQGQILNMTNGRVNIFDENNNFKSTYEILQGVAEVWQDLSSIDQAELLETLAGKMLARIRRNAYIEYI